MLPARDDHRTTQEATRPERGQRLVRVLEPVATGPASAHGPRRRAPARLRDPHECPPSCGPTWCPPVAASRPSPPPSASTPAAAPSRSAIPSFERSPSTAITEPRRWQPHTAQLIAAESGVERGPLRRRPGGSFSLSISRESFPWARPPERLRPIAWSSGSIRAIGSAWGREASGRWGAAGRHRACQPASPLFYAEVLATARPGGWRPTPLDGTSRAQNVRADEIGDHWARSPAGDPGARGADLAEELPGHDRRTALLPSHQGGGRR